MPGTPQTYPALGFYYRVQFANASSGPDVAFKEVSGLSVSMQTEDVAEGGENRFTHRLPTRAKFENLVLKRGLCATKSPLYKWVGASLGGGLASPLQLKSLMVVLMNDKGQPLRKWNCVNAWPVKWDVSGFNSVDAQVLIESMEISYQYFELT